MPSDALFAGSRRNIVVLNNWNVALPYIILSVKNSEPYGILVLITQASGLGISGLFLMTLLHFVASGSGKPRLLHSYGFRRLG